MAERLALLQQIVTGKRMAVVVTRSVLESPVVPGDRVLNQTLVLQRGDSLDSRQLIEKLIQAGYEKVSQVSGRGESRIAVGSSTFSRRNMRCRYAWSFWRHR